MTAKTRQVQVLGNFPERGMPRGVVVSVTNNMARKMIKAGDARAHGEEVKSSEVEVTKPAKDIVTK